MFAPREMNFRGVDLFPDVMHPPPVVRLTVIVDHYVDDGHLRNVAINIIQNTKGTIMGFWNGQRQNHMLSGLTQWQKNLLLPTFGATLMMTYVGAQGMNEMWLKLNLSEYAYGVPGGDDPLCALVLYSGNKVAAIRMDKLKGGAPVYKKTLKKSSWDNDLLYTSQLKLNKKYSVIYSPIKITKNVIEKVNHYSLTTTSVLNSLQHFTAGYELITWSATPRDFTGALPILNGSGNTYYSATTTFEVSPTTGQITATQTADPMADGNLLMPTVIKADGTYYYAPHASGHGSEAALFDILGGTSLPIALTAPPYAGAIYYSTKDTLFEAHTDVLYDFGGARVPYSFAHDVPFMQYSQAGGLDKLDVVFKNISITGSLSPDYASDQATMNAFPVTISGSQPVGVGNLRPLVFPYSWGTSTTDMWWLKDDFPTNQSTLHTPNSADYNYTYGMEPVLPSWIQPTYSLDMWMHVSNGKHVMQGMYVKGHRYLWLDRHSWAPAKIDVDTIQTVILDVPLSRITKLK